MPRNHPTITGRHFLLLLLLLLFLFFFLLHYER